jgi:hypothetical protein
VDRGERERREREREAYKEKEAETEKGHKDNHSARNNCRDIQKKRSIDR